MERRLKSVRWIAARIGAGCLLGVATIAGTGVAAVATSRASAAALNTCVNHHTNVEAYDASASNYYGNKGYVYINTSGALAGLKDAIWRSLFVISTTGTQDVEFGWTDNNSVYLAPTVASDYEVAGTTQPPSFWPSFNLNTNSNVRFRIENLGGHGIFRYVVDGQTSPIAYSPTMSFNSGFAMANDEHYNNCDTLFTDMFSMQDQIGLNDTWGDWGSLACLVNTSVNAWYLHEVTGTELQVNQDANGSIC